MKTSKIIFISFFSVMGLLLISLLIMGFAFKNKKYGDYNAENIKIESVTLDAFKHIHANENCRITVKSGTSNELKYTSFLNKAIIKPDFRIVRDTLFVETTKTNLNNNIELVVQHLETITGNNCNYSLREFSQSRLSVDIKKSNISFYDSSSVVNLKMFLYEQSKCTGREFKVDSLMLQSKNSKFEARLQNKLGLIEGIITDKSDVRLPAALKYTLEVDQSSTIKIY